MPRPLRPRVLSRGRAAALGAAVALGAFAADQISKWLLLDIVGMADAERPVPVLPGFQLVMVWNRGVVFGMLSELDPAWRVPALVGGTGLITLGLVLWLLLGRHGRMMVAAMGLVIGGAVGNLVDRLRFGAVADFFDFYVASWHWPAFNIADSCIVVGVGLILLDGLFDRPQERDGRERGGAVASDPDANGAER